MHDCDYNSQWSEAVYMWVDRKVVHYLKKNRLEYIEIFRKQDQLARFPQEELLKIQGEEADFNEKETAI